jgi:hypothetical protein
LFFFKFGLKFVEFFELKFDSPLHHATGSQIWPLHDAAVAQVNDFLQNSSGCILQRADVTPCYILQWGVRSHHCKMQQGAESYHCIMQRGVKLFTTTAR